MRNGTPLHGKKAHRTPWMPDDWAIFPVRKAIPDAVAASAALHYTTAFLETGSGSTRSSNRQRGAPAAALLPAWGHLRPMPEATIKLRRGAGVAEQAGLENRNTCKRIEGSNPSLSASFAFAPITATT